MKNTHGPTHDDFTLEVIDLFKVWHHGEYNRLKAIR